MLASKTADISRILDFLTCPETHSLPHRQSYSVIPRLSKNSQQLIEFTDVSFSYPDSTTVLLRNISFSINASESIGIVGDSGSGKSTLVDLLLRLLQPDTGHIAFYGLNNLNHTSNTTLDPCLRSPRIGIVPQNVFLIDGTILDNIAFGIDKKSIDFNRVHKVASDACIDSFIQSLPLSYNTLVGERGVYLSGGQVQRIGLARALYLSSDILILDEATSALDQETESELIANIHSLNSGITVIMVAHRLSTLSLCSRIFHVSNGTINEYSSLESYQSSIS